MASATDKHHTEDEQSALVRQILADLQAKQDANPDVVYEVRGDPERKDVPRRLTFDGRDEILAGDDPWTMAWKTADILSGQLAAHFDIFQVRIFTDLRGRETRREESYIVTSCGGSQHWSDEGSLHQVGSAGFCWTCLHPDYDLDQERHGLIRHPVTPAEIGQPGYKCFVCGVTGKDPDHGHADIDHTVIWGEETHPRCTECGQGYQTATPEGIGYVSHAANCRAIHPESGD
jgi:hypothetical protein